MRLGAVALGLVGIAILLAVGCAQSNEAESYMPEASELEDGSWYIDEIDDGVCKGHDADTLRPAKACWGRWYRNSNVRPGEAEDVALTIGVMETEEEAASWLSSYSPPEDAADYRLTKVSPPFVGDDARAWEISGSVSGLAVVFRRGSLAVEVYVFDGSSDQREIMAKLVGEAVLDRFREDSSAASTRCEDSATYLAAASVTAHHYALVVADVLAFTVLRPGQVAELAARHSEFVSDSTDLLDDLRRTADFDAYHTELTATGREVTRGLELLSEGRADEGASVLANLFENLDLAESLPDWVFECGIHG